MRDCLTASADKTPLTSNKRVNYTFGMVLGENEFRQEHENLEWKSRLGNLLLHGYGTVCGLQVTVTGTEVRISAGFAVNPVGRWLWVERDQCAQLDTWLEQHGGEAVTSPTAGPRAVYVKLCYDECPADAVPIAGNACASEEDTRAPSRIIEASQAEFSWTAPAQPAEDHMRLFDQLLARIEIISGPLSPDDSQRLIDAVRQLGLQTSPAVTSPNMDRFFLSEATALETLRRATAVWVTEVRPRISGPGHGCAPQPNDESCVLLARLNFDVDALGRIASPITIDQDRRPLLLPTRLLQEWLLCGSFRQTGAGENVTLQPVLFGLNADDDSQFLLASGARPLSGDLSAGNHRIGSLAAATVNGDAVRFEQAIKRNDPAGADLGGAYPNPTVARLQGRAVSGAAPADGQVLTWNQANNRWEPGNPGPSNLNFMGLPPAAGPYAIVAAGLFRIDNNVVTPVGPVYNGLGIRSLTTPQSDFTLQFNGYRPPDNTFTYIVKATVQDAFAVGSTRSTFQFVRFQNDGIRVRIVGVDGVFQPPGVMIEISAFGAFPQ